MVNVRASNETGPVSAGPVDLNRLIGELLVVFESRRVSFHAQVTESS
jgi:hypothetical protein